MRTIFTFTLLLLLAPITRLSAQDTASQYKELWTKAKEAYDKAAGYHSTVIPLTADQLSSNAPDYEEGTDMGLMLDNDPETFWHSDWHNQVTDTHYIQIAPNSPVEGDIAVYVKRRNTSHDHPTLLGCHGSNDGDTWTALGDFMLNNASAGASITSNAISLGKESYKYLRLYLLANTDGSSFGHFAELRLLNVETIGDGTAMELGYVKDLLFEELLKGVNIQDEDITDEMLNNLQSVYNNFRDMVAELYPELPPMDVKQKSNLPTLVIDTYDGKDITTRQEYKYARMYRIDGEKVTVYDSMRIRGRGNSTWGLAKKPYRIKFYKKERFLGNHRANAKNWTLLANHGDKTLLRNATASFIANALGQPFAPAAEFVDLVLNGQYLGNYQVSDQVEIKKKRVEIFEQEVPPVGDDADISGGYLVEFDGFAYKEPVWFNTNNGQPVTIKSPDDDVITEAQKDYISNYLNEFEARLYADNYTDPNEGYRSMVDSTTLASWFVGTEYTGNTDGYWSTFAYKNKGDDKLYWGPMWDYDIAFNNCIRKGEVTDKLMLNAGSTSGKMKEYVQRMYNDEWFRNLAGRLWHKAVVKDGLVEKTIAYVDSMSAVIDESQKLNFEKWSLSEHVYDEIVLFSTYQEGVDYLKKFLREHADFLSATFPNPEGLFPPEPAPTNPLGAEDNLLYYIYNVNTDNVTDITGDEGISVCTWAKDENRLETQAWKLVPASGDYYRIVMPGSQMAITDMAEQSMNGYNTGSALELREAEDGNARQLWLFVPTADNFAIVNKLTHLAWNNQGGNADDGNPIISWVNNADNASRPTRQWRIEKACEIIPEGIAQVDGTDVEYRVGYDPVAQVVVLHLPADAAGINNDIRLYDTNGRMLGQGDAHTAISVAHLPAGVYIVSWNVQGNKRSVKFVKK